MFCFDVVSFLKDDVQYAINSASLSRKLSTCAFLDPYYNNNNKWSDPLMNNESSTPLAQDDQLLPHFIWLHS